MNKVELCWQKSPILLLEVNKCRLQIGSYKMVHQINITSILEAFAEIEILIYSSNISLTESS